jgi:hypothetical protein
MVLVDRKEMMEDPREEAIIYDMETFEPGTFSFDT